MTDWYGIGEMESAKMDNDNLKAIFNNNDETKLKENFRLSLGLKTDSSPIINSIYDNHEISEFDIASVFDKRDEILKRSQIRIKAHHNIDTYYVLDHANPLKTNKLPLIPSNPISQSKYSDFNTGVLQNGKRDRNKEFAQEVTSELQKKKLNPMTDPNNLEASYLSGKSWKYLNIQKHGIGSIDDISQLIDHFIKEAPTSGNTSPVEIMYGAPPILSIEKLFKPYVITASTNNNIIEYNKNQKYTLKNEPPKYLQGSEPKAEAVFLFNIFENVIKCIRNISTHYIQNINNNEISLKEHEQLVKNVNSSITSLQNLLHNVLFNYINVIPFKKKSPYGFTSLSDYNTLKSRDVRNSYYQLNKSMTRSPDSNLDNIKQMIFQFQDDLNGNPIEMGGFCQETFIFRLSLKIYNTGLKSDLSTYDEYNAVEKFIELSQKSIYVPLFKTLYDKIESPSNASTNILKSYYEKRLNITKQVTRLNRRVKYNKRELEILKCQYIRFDLIIHFIERCIKKNTNRNKLKEYMNNIRLEYNKKETEHGFKIDDLTYINSNNSNITNKPITPKSAANALLNNINKLTREIERDLNNSNDNSLENDNSKKSKKKSKKSKKSKSSKKSKVLSTVLKKYKRLGSIYKHIKGKTIYIPFIDKGILRPDRFGFINILNVAINGKFTNEDLIKGSSISDAVFIQDMSSTGFILVGGNLSEMKTNAKWRAINMKIIKEMMDMSSSRLRKRIDRLLSDEYTYNKYVKYVWADSSQTKVKVKEYCTYIKQKMKKEGKKGKCDILLHTARISRWIM